MENDDMSDWSETFVSEICKEESGSSDEDVPLSKLRETFKKTEKGSESELDDSDGDKTYNPNKEDVNSSDSNCSISEVRKMKLPSAAQKINSKCRDKAWKKKGKHIKRKKVYPRRKLTFTPQRKKSEIMAQKRKRNVPLSPFKRQIEKAKRLSHKEQTLRVIMDKYHRKRLDNLLASNGLKRVRIADDGDCFFSAVAWSLKDIKKTANDIRIETIDHMTVFEDTYISFVASDDMSDKKELYAEKLEEIKQPGHWNTDLADVLPLAVANLMNCRIKMFTSSVTNPTYDVIPTLTNETAIKNITLAYTAIIGNDHYDGVEKFVDGNLTSRKTNPEKESTDELNQNQENEHTAGSSTVSPESPIECAATAAESSAGRSTTTQETQDSSMTSPESPGGCAARVEDSPPVTPHKTADYNTPKKKMTSRKRFCQPECWKANKRKRKRNTGEEYISKKGKVIEARSIKEVHCKCKFKCTNKIDDEQRKNIFESYWGLGHYERQRDFLCKHVTKSQPARSKGNKSVTYNYHFSIGEERIRVCRTFFLQTLDIGKKTVHYNLKRKEHGTFIGSDSRGKHPPTNKTPEAQIRYVHEHIKSFPTMEAHYTRKHSKRQYLEQGLTISQMWRMYVEKCTEKGLMSVKEKQYRDVFCQNYNYSFFKPKKDQCTICTTYEIKKQDGTVDEKAKMEFEQHQERKVASREEKQKDKDLAICDNSKYVATFDLQAVLSTPCTLAGELYYRRKLSVYNLSFYSLTDKNGVCYLWDETQAKRGSCEVATCILMYINSVTTRCSTVTDVTFYCDTCGGQNRNQFVAAALLYSITNNPSNKLQSISQKFFEKGHSQMESDSIHAAIEIAKQNTVVFVPSNWHTVISVARKAQPYVIVPVKYNDILDLKTFTKAHCPNMKLATDGKRVNWLNVKWITVKKDHPRSIFISYTFEENKLMEINVQQASRTRGRPDVWPTMLDKCYDTKLPISSAKKNDLVALCEMGVIPEDCHSYYKGLACSKSVKDKLPEPSADDSESDTDVENN